VLLDTLARASELPVIVSRRSSAIAVLAAVALAVPAVPHGHSGNVLQGFGRANVDGVLSPGEWSGAQSQEFRVNLLEGGSVPGTIFVMNDPTTLYIGLRVMRAAYGGDVTDDVRFLFDNAHNGGIRQDDGDDVLHAVRGRFVDQHFDPNGPFFNVYVPDGTQGRGTQDVNGAVTNDGRSYFYEVSHPLNSADDRADFSLSAGNTVGFGIQIGYCGASCVVGAYWPGGPPDFWADVVVRAGPLPTDADRDGLGDAADGCPTVPGGRFDSNRNGCPGPYRTIGRLELKSTADVYAGTIRYYALRIEGLPRSGATVVIQHGGRREVLSAFRGVVRSRLLVGRRLRAGARVILQATEPGWVGYWGRFRLHTSSPLLREVVRRCIPAEGPQRPVRCSAALRGR
jgi:hypothetical protein